MIQRFKIWAKAALLLLLALAVHRPLIGHDSPVFAKVALPGALGVVAPAPSPSVFDRIRRDQLQTDPPVLQRPLRDPIEPQGTRTTKPSCGKRESVRLVDTGWSFVGCDYASILKELDRPVDIEWVLSKRPLGTIEYHAQRPGSKQVNLRVSYGPSYRIEVQDVFAGDALTFTLPARLPYRSANYKLDYKITTDAAGQQSANVRSRNFAFRDRSELRIPTSASQGEQTLYLHRTLTYPKRRSREGMEILATGRGTIFARPRLEISDASADEGSNLQFLAKINRAGGPQTALIYEGRFVPVNAELNTDYRVSETFDIKILPDRSDTAITVATLPNLASQEDRILMLRASDQRGVVGQATGTILNVVNPPPPDLGDGANPDDPFGQNRPEDSIVDPATPQVEPLSSDVGGETDTDDTSPSGSGGGVTPKPVGFLDWGLEILATIGALAIGLLAGFLFATKKTSSGGENGDALGGDETDPVSAQDGSQAAKTALASAPVVSWQSIPTSPPVPEGNSIDIVSPGVAIEVSLDPAETDPATDLAIETAGVENA